MLNHYAGVCRSSSRGKIKLDFVKRVWNFHNMESAVASQTRIEAEILPERIAKELAFNYMLGWIERAENPETLLKNRDANIRRASKRAESRFEVFMGVSCNLLNRPEGENTHWKTARFQPKETCP